MKVDKYTQLRSALINASLYASDFKDEDDGGTCNFDTVTIRLPRWPYAKLKEMVATIPGLRISKHYCGVAGTFMIHGFEHGQANRRTSMVEAFSRRLCELGYDSGVYYVMD